MSPGVHKVRGMTKRLGLIGDVHAQDERLRLAIDHLQELNIETIICTGDIVDGPGDPDACVELLKVHDIQTVRGNHDRWCLEDKARHVPNAHRRESLKTATREYLTALPRQLEIMTSRGKLLLCHGIGNNDLAKVWPGTERMPIERSEALDNLIDAGDFRFVVNGHMHFKTMIHFETLTLINAGTITGIRWPGFTVIDFETGHVDTFRFEESGIVDGKRSQLFEKPDVVFSDTRDFTGDWHPQLLFHMPANP